MDVIKLIGDSARWVVSGGKWVILRLFDEQTLKKSISVNARALSNACELDCMSGALTLWITIVNQSPFDFELEHCIVKFNLAGFTCALTPDKRYKVPSLGQSDVILRSYIMPDQRIMAAKSEASSSNPFLEYSLKFSSKLISFPIEGGLSQIPFIKVNDQAARENLLSA